MEFSYERRTVPLAGSAQAEVYVVCFPAASLHFTTITQTAMRTRVQDAAHLRYFMARVRGDSDPVIIAWACLEHDMPVVRLFPGTDAVTETGERILSANSWITYVLRTLLARGWLHWHAGTWQVTAGDAPGAWRVAAEETITWLVQQNRLHLHMGPGQIPPAHLDFNGFDVIRNLVPVGQCGFVRDYAAAERPRAAFNSAFFLLEHNDFLSHHSALGDAHSLSVEAGTITRPPLYRRGAIWHTPAHGWQTGHLDMRDIALVLPNGTTLYPAAHSGEGLHFYLNAEHVPGPIVYTRTWGIAQHGRVLGHTPEHADRLEITIVDSRVVGWKTGGGLTIPQNGFVLSFDPSMLPGDVVESVQQFGHVGYHFADTSHQSIDWAIQCGPQLIQNGDIVLHAQSLRDEDFWISQMVEGQYVLGVVPTDYPDDVDRTRAGRIGLGIDSGGDLLAVVVPGTNKYATQAATSAGATLQELAGYLRDAGAVEAINLDGGGSTQCFVDGGLLARQGDPRGYPEVIFDRMVPAIGVVRAAE